MSKIKLKDWQVRTLKTFVETFGGIMVPAIAGLLANIELLMNWNLAKATLVSAFCGGVSAGITAAWNIYLEHKRGANS